MTVRAKFKVGSVKFSEGSRDVLDAEGKPVKDERGYRKTAPCEMMSVEMFPVYSNGDPNHENTKFWQASPGGKLELNVINPEAGREFKVGREFYVDFTPAV